MIRRNIFEVSEDEKRRILGLHESATKKHYLIKEQEITGDTSTTSGDTPTNMTQQQWRLNEFTITKDGENYTTQLITGETIQLPKLSELGIDVESKKVFNWNELTYNGIYVGEQMALKRPTPPDQTVPEGGGLGQPVCYIDNSGIPVFNLMSVHQNKRYGSAGGGELTKSNTEVVYNKTYNKIYIITVANGIRSVGRPYTPKIKETPPENLNLNMDDPFEFDSTVLTPEAQVKFNKFISDLTKWQWSIPHGQGGIKIETYASIDGDPNEVLTKKGNITRFNYDKKLSDDRANVIMKVIRDAIGLSGINIQAISHGETNKFGPGWTKEKPTTFEETKANRKLVVTVPQITTKK